MLTSEEYQREAVQHYKQGNYSKCIQVCNEAIRNDLQTGSIYNVKSLAAMALKRYDEAADAINEAVLLSPQNETYLKNKVKIDTIVTKKRRGWDIELPDEKNKNPGNVGEPEKNQDYELINRIPQRFIGVALLICVITGLFFMLFPIVFHGNANTPSSYASNQDYYNSPGPENNLFNINGQSQQVVYHTDKDGKITWTYSTKHGIDSLPILSRGVIYYGTSHGYLVALDATNGQEKWEILLDPRYSKINPPNVLNGVVYAKDDYYILHAVDLVKGKEIWQYKLSDRYVKPFFSNEGIYFIDNKNLIGLDPVSGHEIGRVKIISDFRGLFDTIIGVSKGIVCVCDSENGINGIDFSSGQLKWNLPYGGGRTMLPTLSDGIIYAINQDSLNGISLDYLVSIDAVTGQEIWKFKIEDDVNINIEGFSSPKVTNRVVYVGGNQYLYAVDAMSGQLKWKSNEIVNPRPIYNISEGMVFFLSSDGYIHAVDAITGQKKWERKSESSIRSYESIPGAIDKVTTIIGGLNSVLYVIVEKGNLMALDISTGQDKWTHKAGKFTFLNEMSGVICVELDGSTGEYHIYSIQ